MNVYDTNIASPLISKLLFSYSEQTVALTAASDQDLFIKCPALDAKTFVGAILRVKGEADGLTTCTIAEATASTDGTAKAPLNRNRRTSIASPVLVFLAPGTPVIVTPLQIGFATLGQNFESYCWLLKPATNYIFRMTATGGTRNVVANLELHVLPNAEYLIKPWS